MIIRRIEQRLQEEEKVSKYIGMLDKLYGRLKKEIGTLYAEMDGEWSLGKLAEWKRKQIFEEQVRNEINQWKELLKNEYSGELVKDYQEEYSFQNDLISKITGKQSEEHLNNTILDFEQLRNLITDECLIKGKSMNDYLSKWAGEQSFAVEQAVFDGIALGKNPKQVWKDLGSLNEKERIRTDVTVRAWYSRTINQASADSYSDIGLEKCKWLSTLDMIACPICSARHMQIFLIKDIVLLLPAHPGCRCTTIPFFGDDKLDAVSEKLMLGNWYKERSQEEIDSIKNQVIQFKKYNKISEKEADYLLKLLNNADKKGIIETVEKDFDFNSWYKHSEIENAIKTRDISNDSRVNIANDLLKKLSSKNICDLDSKTRSNGYNILEQNSKDEIVWTKFALKENDSRPYQYKIKTIFHELSHNRRSGLKGVNIVGETYKKNIKYEEIYAECTAHYITRNLNIEDNMLAAYAGEVADILPILKSNDKFSKCNSISDFGGIFYKDYFIDNSVDYSEIRNIVENSTPINKKEYLNKYVDIMKENKEIIANIISEGLANINIKDLINEDIDKFIAGENIDNEELFIVACFEIGGVK